MNRAPSNRTRLIDSAPALVAFALIAATLVLWIDIAATLAGAR